MGVRAFGVEVAHGVDGLSMLVSLLISIQRVAKENPSRCCSERRIRWKSRLHRESERTGASRTGWFPPDHIGLKMHVSLLGPSNKLSVNTHEIWKS